MDGWTEGGRVEKNGRMREKLKSFEFRNLYGRSACAHTELRDHTVPLLRLHRDVHRQVVRPVRPSGEATCGPTGAPLGPILAAG